MNNHKLRLMTKDDLDSVVKVHQNAFPNFFLSLLGPLFLRRYYLIVLKFKNSISIVHLDSNNIVDGFAVGFKNPDSFYRFFIKNSLLFVSPLIHAIFCKPRIIKLIIMNIMRVSSRSINDFNKSSCELSSIAVLKSGNGIGGHLLRKFIRVAKDRDYSCISLTTDGDLGNKIVIDFYTSHGFSEICREMRGDRQMVHFELTLNN